MDGETDWGCDCGCGANVEVSFHCASADDPTEPLGTGECPDEPCCNRHRPRLLGATCSGGAAWVAEGG